MYHHLNAAQRRVVATYTERQGELGRSIHAQACIWLRPGVRRVCDVEKLMEREDCAGSSLEF